jgi:hypothetical protein
MGTSVMTHGLLIHHVGGVGPRTRYGLDLLGISLNSISIGFLEFDFGDFLGDLHGDIVGINIYQPYPIWGILWLWYLRI